MANNKLSGTNYTDMTNTVESTLVYAVDDSTQITFQEDWGRWNGYYKQIPELQAVIDKKAIWTIGKGYKTSEATRKILEKIKGNGKDTFNGIMDNAVKTYTIGGNFYAEIIRNSRGEIKNLKPMNPSSIVIHANGNGIIKYYEQLVQADKSKNIIFDPKDIFHLQWNRIADEIHGNGTIEKIENIILMRNEAMTDMKTVFHRYVKPLWIFSVDTDNTTEIDAFKVKVDRTVANAENLVVPKDTVDKIERVSIPQYSTLDPLPWIKLLQNEFIRAEGVPEVILGNGESATEATAKILYLAFQQMIEYNQMFLEEQIKAQLGLEVEFNFPASIQPDLQTGNQKARDVKNMEMNPNQAVR